MNSRIVIIGGFKYSLVEFYTSGIVISMNDLSQSYPS